MIAIADNPVLAQATGVLHPLVILLLCVIAGVGTVVLLPGRREKSIGRIGGALLLIALLIFIALLVRQTDRFTGGEGYFWIFSVLALFGAVRVITHPRPVYSALYFVLTVLASAGLFVLLWAEFMAAALVLIYAGAILVTYVFVIMLAQQAQQPQGTQEPVGAPYDQTSREPIIASAVGFTLMGVLLFVIFDKGESLAAMARPAPPAETFATVTQLAAYLFSEQLVSFELAGLMLTIGMFGAVVIARRQVSAEKPLHGEELPPAEPSGELVTSGSVPTGPDDNPHSIPVYGTRRPQAKAYPEK